MNSTATTCCHESESLRYEVEAWPFAMCFAGLSVASTIGAAAARRDRKLGRADGRRARVDLGVPAAGARLCSGCGGDRSSKADDPIPRCLRSRNAAACEPGDCKEPETERGQPRPFAIKTRAQLAGVPLAEVDATSLARSRRSARYCAAERCRVSAELEEYAPSARTGWPRRGVDIVSRGATRHRAPRRSRPLPRPITRH